MRSRVPYAHGRFRFVVLLPLAIFLTNELFAQPDSVNKRTNHAWISLALGVFGNRDFVGFGGFAGFSYLTKPGLFSVRLSNSENSQSIRTAEDVLLTSPNGQVESFSEASALYGRTLKRGWFMMSISAGAGLLWGEQRNPNKNNFITVGIPCELQVMFIPLPGIGMGVSAFANANNTITHTGLAFGLQFGRLRP
jgi:hypothetical protein